MALFGNCHDSKPGQLLLLAQRIIKIASSTKASTYFIVMITVLLDKICFGKWRSIGSITWLECIYSAPFEYKLWMTFKKRKKNEVWCANAKRSRPVVKSRPENLKGAILEIYGQLTSAVGSYLLSDLCSRMKKDREKVFSTLLGLMQVSCLIRETVTIL